MVVSDATSNISLRLSLTALAAMGAETATFPLDITKTRMQLHGTSSLGQSPQSAFGTAAAIVREEGMAGLYRGLSPALARHVLYTSIRIGTYEQLREYVKGGRDDAQLSVGTKALVGGAAGVIGQVVASPADLVKVRMQADGRLRKLGHPPRYSGLMDALAKIVRQEGFAGLYRGVGPNAQRAFLVNMGELSCYDHAKHAILTSGLANDNVYAHSLASGISGLAATTLSCPADVVKTRMMNQMGQSGASEMTGPHGILYKNALDCLAKTVRSEGVGALWRGFLPTWARLGPWQFVFWVTYERLRQLCGLSSF